MLDLTATVLTVAIVGCCVLLHFESLRLLQFWFGNTRRHRTSVLFCMVGLLFTHIAEIWVFALGYWASVYWLELGTITPQLDDPEDHFDKNVVVVGTGDAGIENALGLATDPALGNTVTILNRGTDFAKAKTKTRPTSPLLAKRAI